MCWPMLRATVSVVPPGGAPTTSLTGGVWAATGRPNAQATSAQRDRKR